MKRLSLALAALALASAPAWAADSGYPVTVQDASGVSLTLASKPRAIVSLTLPTDEILLDLVDPSRLKAIDAFASDPGISNIASFASTFPNRITGEKEKVVALQPDLVLVADWSDKAFVQSLRDARIPVFLVRSSNDFDDLNRSIVQLATLVGEPARGQALVNKVSQRLAAVAAKVKAGAGTSRPTVLSYSFWGSTYAKGTSFDALVAKAGLVNAATASGLSGWPQLSKEQILSLDPDLIVLPSWSYDGKANPDQFLAQFLADPVFASLKAVRNKHVVILSDRHLQATSQYMADGVEDLAKAAFPALF